MTPDIYEESQRESQYSICTFALCYQGFVLCVFGRSDNEKERKREKKNIFNEANHPGKKMSIFMINCLIITRETKKKRTIFFPVIFNRSCSFGLIVLEDHEGLIGHSIDFFLIVD